jgi:hypothetical protein
MRCQTRAAGANDPRRVNNHLLSPELPTTLSRHASPTPPIGYPWFTQKRLGPAMSSSRVPSLKKLAPKLRATDRYCSDSTK